MLAGASLAGQLIGFIVLAVVTRRIGAEPLGAWYLASSIVSYFGLFVGLGMATRATRDVAQDPASARRVSGEVVVTSVLLAGSVYGVFLVLAPTIAAENRDLERLLPIAGLMLFVNAATLEWTLQALRTVRALALWRLAGQVFYGVAAVLLVTQGLDGAVRYAALNVAGVTLTAMGSWWSVVRRAGRPELTVKWQQMKTRVVSSVPFGITLVMTQIYWTMGTVLLGFIGSTRAVGEYGVALKLPQVAIALTLLWVSTLFPHAAALHKSRPERLRGQLERIAVLGAVLLLPAVIVGPFVASELMVFMFGEEFAGAGKPFSYLVVLSVVTFLSVNFTNTLLAIGGERRFMSYAVLAGVAAIAINVALIPRIGAVAPAVATIAAELIVGVLAVRRIGTILGPIRPDIRMLVRAVPAIALATGVMVLGADLDWRLRAAAAVVIYFAAAIAFGALRVRDLAAGRGAGGQHA
ncbi:MAG: flippase [Patulibacter sp.]|nr:flippase [Patulibacter sp.]